MTQLPLVSIVTPSYNQARFLEETMLSVLSQDYPNIEYLVIDGGSSDGSAEIIRRYADRLAFWVSEPDRGQAHALQKGFARALGEIIAFLNSDDVYLPGAVATAVEILQDDPELMMVHGDSIYVDAAGQEIGRKVGAGGDFLSHFLRQFNPISQPSTFLRRSAYDIAGGIDPTLHLAMDYDLWCRIGLRGMRIRYLPVPLSLFRIHGQSKTKLNIVAFAEERWRLLEQYLGDPVLGPRLAPYHRRLYGMAHLRFANAYWMSGEKREAHSHFWQMLQMAPRCMFSRVGFSLLARFVLRRRHLRRRAIDASESAL
jgi:glycosyltransferase involved in cell wall biosynthesis